MPFKGIFLKSLLLRVDLSKDFNREMTFYRGKTFLSLFIKKIEILVETFNMSSIEI